MKKSWKTTVGGIAAILAAITGAIIPLVDDDISTKPNWELVVGGIASGGALLFARDNDVSSESAGAK